MIGEQIQASLETVQQVIRMLKGEPRQIQHGTATPIPRTTAVLCGCDSTTASGIAMGFIWAGIT